MEAEIAARRVTLINLSVEILVMSRLRLQDIDF